jgi:hypothetical protein
VLKDPAVLSEKFQAHKAHLGAREVEVRSEAVHLARQLVDLERQEQRLLDFYLEEHLAVPSLKTRLAELTTRKAAVDARLPARSCSAERRSKSAACCQDDGCRRAIVTVHRASGVSSYPVKSVFTGSAAALIWKTGITSDSKTTATKLILPHFIVMSPSAARGQPSALRTFSAPRATHHLPVVDS